MKFREFLEMANTGGSDFSLLQGTKAARLAEPNFYFQIRRLAKAKTTHDPAEIGGPEFCKQISELIAKATGAQLQNGNTMADKGFQYGHAFNSIQNTHGQTILIDGSHEQEIWNEPLSRIGLNVRGLKNVGDAVTAIGLSELSQKDPYTAKLLSNPDQHLYKHDPNTEDGYGIGDKGTRFTRQKSGIDAIKRLLPSLNIEQIKKSLHPFVLKVQIMNTKEYKH